MGMEMSLLVLPDALLAAFRKHPAVIDLAEECDGDVGEMRDPGDSASQAEVDAFFAEPGVADHDECFDAQYEIDRWWAGVHFLLTGTDAIAEMRSEAPRSPLARVILGDAVHGASIATFAHDAADVRAIAEALRPVRRASLAERFDPAAMSSAHIYPEWWSDDEARDVVDVAWDVRRIYVRAARDGLAIMTRIA
jgi:Domain of unknown function (DUF1877)